MSFKAKPFLPRKQAEPIDFMSVSALRIKGENCPLVTYCFNCRFHVATVSPLKGAAGLETTAPIRGMRGCV